MTKMTKTATTKSHQPILRFSPTAWAKQLFLRDAGETEIGGFGISDANDLLFVEDIALVNQECTWVHVAFDDSAVAELFDQQVDAGRRPEQFARIWIHTHPGRSADPSGKDEATFSRVFGGSDWAVMFILACGGQSYARLRYNVGPGADIMLPVEVDYSKEFTGSDFDAWQDEYLANVRVPEPEPVASLETEVVTKAKPRSGGFFDDWWPDAWDDYIDIEQDEKEVYGFIRDF